MNPYQAYAQYSTTYPDLEQIGGVLYDTVTYVSGTTTVLNMFNAVRAIQLSNMEIPNQLPNPKAFLIRCPKFNVLQQPLSIARAAAGAVCTGAADNIAQLINTGLLTLIIGAKPYMQFPLWTLPGATGIFGLAGLDGNTADPGATVQWATNGRAQADTGLTLTKPVPIVPQINFSVQLTWPAALTLAGGDTAVQVIFDGTLVRPVQ